MKNKFLALVVFFTVLLLISCTTDSIEIEENAAKREVVSSFDEPRIIVFGRYYGKCEGMNCVEVYKFNGRQLTEDVTNIRPTMNDFFKGEFRHVINLDERLNLPGLIAELPLKELNSGRENVFGFPGYYDQGVYYLEYNDGVNKQFWVIDSDLDNIPNELHAYVVLLSDIITIIQEADTTF